MDYTCHGYINIAELFVINTIPASPFTKPNYVRLFLPVNHDIIIYPEKLFNM